MNVRTLHLTVPNGMRCTEHATGGAVFVFSSGREREFATHLKEWHETTVEPLAAAYEAEERKKRVRRHRLTRAELRAEITGERLPTAPETPAYEAPTVRQLNPENESDGKTIQLADERLLLTVIHQLHTHLLDGLENLLGHSDRFPILKEALEKGNALLTALEPYLDVSDELNSSPDELETASTSE